MRKIGLVTLMFLLRVVSLSAFDIWVYYGANQLMTQGDYYFSFD
jgi:hypothetical protein